MKFLVDNQLPAALAYYLRARGFDSQHVLEAGLSEASDAQICRYPMEQERIIVTKDEDFFYLASRRKSLVKLLWVRLGNCRTKVLLDAFETVWPKVEACFKAGERIIELR